MSGLRNALAIGAAFALCAGCSGGVEPSAPEETGSIAAYPDLPHVSGPLDVRLQPALLMPATAPCRPVPEQRIVCSADRTRTFKVLGQDRRATIAEVGTAPSPDHTSWTTTVRFAPASRAATTGTARQAGGFGGVVLALSGGHVLDVIDPADLHAREARFLGLQKPEAWAVVNAFRP